MSGAQEMSIKASLKGKEHFSLYRSLQEASECGISFEFRQICK